MQLKYPNDRVNGYVQLTDGEDFCFVPEFTKVQNDALAYCQAFMTLARRLEEQCQQT